MTEFNPYAAASDIRAHYQSPSVAVLIPASQSLITGASIGMSATAAAWFVGVDNPWRIGLLAATVSQSVSWGYLVKGWKRMIVDMEKALGLDINQDGFIGSRQQLEPQTVRFEMVTNGGRQIDIIDLPATPEQLREFVHGYFVKDIGLGESDWTGSSKPFTKDEWHDLRDTLIKRGLAYWKNSSARSQGFALTAAGKNVFRRYAQQIGVLPHSPTGKDASHAYA